MLFLCYNTDIQKNMLLKFIYRRQLGYVVRAINSERERIILRNIYDWDDVAYMAKFQTRHYQNLWKKAEDLVEKIMKLDGDKSGDDFKDM